MIRVWDGWAEVMFYYYIVHKGIEYAVESDCELDLNARIELTYAMGWTSLVWGKV